MLFVVKLRLYDVSVFAPKFHISSYHRVRTLEDTVHFLDGNGGKIKSIIGSAEALPILCVRYFRCEREREREIQTETEVTSPLSR